MFGRKYYILVISVLLGFLIATQSRSFQSVNTIMARDTGSNVFQEIKILKDKNQDLRDEVDGLQTTLEQLSDQNLALDAIQEEINKYKKLSGEYSVFGPGVVISIDGEISTVWMTDIINELFSIGAEAVSVNEIRISNISSGFDTLPQGQIMLNDSILSSPYIFKAIGNDATLVDSMELPGGIFDRLEANFPGIKIATEVKEVIKMD